MPCSIPTAAQMLMPSPPHDSPGLSGTGTRFAFLDALRGLGALGIRATTFIGIGHWRFRRTISCRRWCSSSCVTAGCSVQVFWVIAGFVVAYSLRKTAVGPASFGNFTLRRVLRLGMPYWTAILAVVAIDALTKPWLPDPPLVDDPVGWSRLAANLGFLQDVLHLGNISAGTWFVCVDLQFGLLFMVMLGIVQGILAARAGERAVARTRTPWF